MNNTFFNPTPLYKEFVILDLIEKNKNITQRFMSEYLNVSVSMINLYLDKYEKNKFIKRTYINSKKVFYKITKKGIERKKVLNIRYLENAYSIYLGAKNNIDDFLKQIIDKGFEKIMLYGGGEVAEILLQTIYADNSIPLEVVAVIDDDLEKQNTKLLNTSVISNNNIKDFIHDGILISSYVNRKTIYKKLLKINYDEEKILHFFK